MGYSFKSKTFVRYLINFIGLLREQLGEQAHLVDQENDIYDSTNDVTDEGFEIGPKWRKVRLHLLLQQLHRQFNFL